MRPPRHIFVLAICGVIFIAGVRLARATTYYVATTGSNANACTVITSPCQTIAGALGKATAAGSIIQVAAGTYSESIDLTHSGTSGNPIILRGQDGSGCPTTPVTDVNHPTGFRPAPVANIAGTITIDASWVNIDCMHTSGANAGILINHPYSNDQITNNETSGDGTLTSTMHGITFNGLSSMSAAAYDTNFTITGNYIHGTLGIWLLCSNCTVSENEITALMGSEVNSGNMSDHDYMDVWGNTTVIRHNYMHANTCNSCNGLDCHMDCAQTFNNTGDGTEVSKNITFDRNVCFNHHEGVIVQDNAGSGDVANWTVMNNVFAYGPYDDGSGHMCVAGTAHPWCWVFEDGAQGTSNFFENNTCIDGSMGFRSNTGSAVYKNNLFYSYGTLTSIYDNSGATVTGANNLDYAASQSFGSGTFTGDIINQDPRFQNLGTGAGTQQCIGCYFDVQSSSPAINAGVNTSPQVTVDLLGNSRPEGTAYDIGAYELILGASVGDIITPGINMTAGVAVH